MTPTSLVPIFAMTGFYQSVFSWQVRQYHRPISTRFPWLSLCYRHWKTLSAAGPAVCEFYWFRLDWFERDDIKKSFKEKYGYELGVPVNCLPMKTLLNSSQHPH